MTWAMRYRDGGGWNALFIESAPAYGAVAARQRQRVHQVSVQAASPPSGGGGVAAVAARIVPLALTVYRLPLHGAIAGGSFLLRSPTRTAAHCTADGRHYADTVGAGAIAAAILHTFAKRWDIRGQSPSISMPTISAEAYLATLDHMNLFCRRMAHAADAFDAIISPVFASPALPHGVLSHDRSVDSVAEFFADVFRRAAFTVQYNLTGQPAVWSALEKLVQF